MLDDRRIVLYNLVSTFEMIGYYFWPAKKNRKIVSPPPDDYGEGFAATPERRDSY
jgi:hypothetical protein